MQVFPSPCGGNRNHENSRRGGACCTSIDGGRTTFHPFEAATPAPSVTDNTPSPPRRSRIVVRHCGCFLKHPQLLHSPGAPIGRPRAGSYRRGYDYDQDQDDWDHRYRVFGQTLHVSADCVAGVLVVSLVAYQPGVRPSGEPEAQIVSGWMHHLMRHSFALLVLRREVMIVAKNIIRNLDLRLFRHVTPPP